MSVQITIIGLGQVGSSIGLALAEQKSIKRVGHDKDYGRARAAHKAGAVDETNVNLPSSVSNANIVLLCLPLSEIRETLKYIARDLQEGTVILDTAPAKATVAAWVNELVLRDVTMLGSLQRRVRIICTEMNWASRPHASTFSKMACSW